MEILKTGMVYRMDEICDVEDRTDNKGWSRRI